MMDTSTLARILAINADVAAVQARIAGMDAENRYREACGNSPAYCQDAFDLEAATLHHLAECLRSQA